MTSRAPVVIAGVLGGSGTHIFQIIIAIVVVAGLIGYFAVRLAGRDSGGDVRAVTTAVNQPGRANAGSESDATLRLVRLWSGIAIGAQSAQWNITIDGTVVGSIANNETVEVSVEPGHHTLRLGSGRRRSRERSFDVAQDEVAGFRCHGPRIWPMLVAGLINPDLWISLTPG